MGKKNYIPEGEWVLEEMLKVAMEDEKNDWMKFRKLAKVSSKSKDREKLFKIADEEKKHLQKLLYIHKRIYGMKKIHISSREQSVYRFDITLGKSIAAKYEGLAFYQEILGRLPCEETKNVLRLIMAEEQEQALVLESIMECEHKKKHRENPIE